MTIQEFYSEINGNYEEAKARLMKDDRIVKYVRKFPLGEDYPTFFTSVEAGDWATAFRNVHSIKGNCLNLSMTGLADVSSRLCETIRNGAPTEDISGLIEEFKSEYKKVVDAVEKLD